MTVIPFPRLEQVAPSCSSLRELVRQLVSAIPVFVQIRPNGGSEKETVPSSPSVRQ